MNNTKVQSLLSQYRQQVNTLRQQDLSYTEHIARLANIDLDLKVSINNARCTIEEDDYIMNESYKFAYGDGWLMVLGDKTLARNK